MKDLKANTARVAELVAQSTAAQERTANLCNEIREICGHAKQNFKVAKKNFNA